MTRGVEIASGKGRALAAPNVINASNSAHNFSVKLSLFMSSIIAACSGSPPQCSTFSS